MSYVEMLKILMLARVLHVKMSDASLILEEMRRVRSWQQRVLAALGDGEENSKNDKKISEEHVEKFIESSKHLLVPVSESRKLSNLLERSRDWVKRFRKAQNTQDSNGSTLQTLVRIFFFSLTLLNIIELEHSTTSQFENSTTSQFENSTTSQFENSNTDRYEKVKSYPLIIPQ